MVEEKLVTPIKEAELVEEVAPKEEEFDPLKVKVTELKNLSTRTLNVLETNKLVKVKDIIKHTEESLKGLEGMGDKGIKEIKKSIGELGLTLKQ